MAALVKKIITDRRIAKYLNRLGGQYKLVKNLDKVRSVLELPVDQANYFIRLGLFGPYTEPVGEKYTVSFSAGEGTGTMDSVPDVSGDYLLPLCTFTPPQGKEFDAWLAKGERKAEGATIVVDSDLTVTALYKAFDLNGYWEKQDTEYASDKVFKVQNGQLELYPAFWAQEFSDATITVKTIVKDSDTQYTLTFGNDQETINVTITFTGKDAITLSTTATGHPNIQGNYARVII